MGAAEGGAQLIFALQTRGWSLAVAESLTGGDLASAVVAVPGASAVFRGGVVAYATSIKQSILRVDADLLRKFGPVHSDVAEQMAVGVRQVMAVSGGIADVGVSTTGIAGPESPDGQPVGTVHIAVSTAAGETSRAFRFHGDRAQVRAASVLAALNLATEIVTGSRE